MRADDTLPLDLLSPSFVTDPVPMIDAMLEQAPVFFDARLNAWLVGGYRDVKALETETRLTSQRESYVSALLPPDLHEDIQPLVDWYAGWMVMRDGAAHRRLRQLTAAAFQPRNIAHLQTRMVAVVDQLLDTALARGEMDLVSEFAQPLPRRMIREMVGIPEAEESLLAEWTRDLTALLAANLTTREAIAHAHQTRMQLRAYFLDKIAQRRRRLVDGEILSSLVEALDKDPSLDEDAIVDLVAFILTGAYDTTAHLIANGLHLLLTNPRQRAHLSADVDGRMAGLIAETLRLEPSITLNTRAVSEPFEYQGMRFEAGQMVYFLAIVANRDPSHFPNPHVFDIERSNAGDHISFGFGPHFCIGAPLARLEAGVAFRRVTARAPHMQLAGDPIERMPNMIVRSLRSLRVRL